MVLIDSDVLIDYLRGLSAARNYLDRWMRLPFPR